MKNYEKLLAQKNSQIQNLEDELITSKKRLQNCRYQKEVLQKGLRRRKLIEAGEVIEKAGLLENYDKDELYLLLVMNKKQLMKG